MNDPFRYLPTTNLMIQIMIQEIESPSILPSKISHILNYRRIERSRYSSSHIYIYFSRTRTLVRMQSIEALLPYLLHLEHRREAGVGLNTSGTRWSNAERLAKT